MVLRLEGSWSLLVGKRFLCLSEEEDRAWDASLISEWPWKSGRIRAVSHTDISKQDLKVTLRESCEMESVPGKLVWVCVHVCAHAALGGRGEERLKTCTRAPVPNVLVLMPQIISN